MLLSEMMSSIMCASQDTFMQRYTVHVFPIQTQAHLTHLLNSWEFNIVFCQRLEHFSIIFGVAHSAFQYFLEFGDFKLKHQ